MSRASRASSGCTTSGAGKELLPLTSTSDLVSRTLDGSDRPSEDQDPDIPCRQSTDGTDRVEGQGIMRYKGSPDLSRPPTFSGDPPGTFGVCW